MSTETNYLDNPEPIIHCDAWCQTEHVDWPSTPYTFVWTIKKFSTRKSWGCGNSLVSSSFDIPIQNSRRLETSWRLQMDRDGDFLSLHVNNYSGFEVKARYKCSILDAKKKRKNVMQSNGEELFDSSYSSISGMKKFVHINGLKGDLLPNDCLHIVCDLSVTGAHLTNRGKKSPDFFDERSSLWENQLSIDLPEALLAMVNLHCTGNAKDFLAASNKNLFDRLMTACEENLCQILDSKNCIKFLIYANIYKAKMLRKRTLEMAAKNLSILMKTNEWKEDLLDYPLLKDEIMETALSLNTSTFKEEDGLTQHKRQTDDDELVKTVVCEPLELLPKVTEEWKHETELNIASLVLKRKNIG